MLGGGIATRPVLLWAWQWHSLRLRGKHLSVMGCVMGWSGVLGSLRRVNPGSHFSRVGVLTAVGRHLAASGVGELEEG